MTRTASVIALNVFVAIAGLASVGQAAAATSAPRGALTAFEYQTLSRDQARLKTVLPNTLKGALSAKKPDWHAAYAACPASGASALLRSETAGCAAGISELSAILSVLSAVKEEPKCASQPGSDPVSCLVPAYQDLDHAASKAVAIDEETSQAAVARGFTGKCLSTLSSTPGYLNTERRFAQLMTETVAAMHALNGPKLQALGPQITKTMNAILSEKSPSNLAVCRHQ